VQGQLDPLKEANASILLASHAVKTHEQIARELGGGDWEENVEQIQRENQLLAAASAGNAKQSDPIAEEKEEGEENE
jgi:capsid protein